jgi:uncharacterized protein (DUF302 family)
LSYYFSQKVSLSFNDAVAVITERLKEEGFGVLTEIDVKATLKEKLNVEFPSYRILGACNPAFAHKALQLEPAIGLMMPCNVIVRELASGEVEVSAVDPQASMQAVENPPLAEVAGEVRHKLRRAIESLSAA